MIEKKKRETSKMLLWTVLSLSALFSIAALVLSSLFGGFEATVTVIGGVWSAAVIAAIGFYSDKAKAENEIKLQALLNSPPELAELREQLAAEQAAGRKLKAERDKAKKEAEQAKGEAAQLRQRLTPLEQIIRDAQQPGTPG